MSEALLTRARCEEIFGLVTAAARSEGVADVEAMLAVGVNALTRFANNTIHQNVSERGSHISVRAVIDGRTARASSNRFDAGSIRRVTSEAIAITRLQAPDADVMPLATITTPAPSVSAGTRFFDATATATPADRARAVKDAIDAVESESLTAAGIYSTNQSALAMLNSRGLFGYHEETMAQFSITAIGADSSGWAKGSACDARSLDTRALAARAARKATASAQPKELARGH